jgi:hypothetical protein
VLQSPRPEVTGPTPFSHLANSQPSLHCFLCLTSPTAETRSVGSHGPLAYRELDNIVVVCFWCPGIVIAETRVPTCLLRLPHLVSEPVLCILSVAHSVQIIPVGAQFYFLIFLREGLFDFFQTFINGCVW